MLALLLQDFGVKKLSPRFPQHKQSMHLPKIALLSLCAATLASSLAATSFDYSYTFGGGVVVSGTFSGNQSGNLISDISDASLLVNGSPLGGTVMAFGYDPTATNLGTPWTGTGAVISIDGTQNSFLFTNRNVAAGDFSQTGWLYSVPTSGGPFTEVVLRDPVTQVAYLWNWDQPLNSSWTVRSIPDGGATVALLGFALVGLGILRRRFGA